MFLSQEITVRKVLATGIGFLGGAMTVAMKHSRPPSRTPDDALPSCGRQPRFLIPAWLSWHPIEGTTCILVIAIALFGSVSQWCFLTAYRLGDLSALAPVEYMRLVMAALLGLPIFAEIPTPIATLGMILACLSAYIAVQSKSSKGLSL